MSDDVLVLESRKLRGTDSNSLLRMYDLANGIFNSSHLQQERARADKVIQRIAKELRIRNVAL
jgi:hypothetical protein